MVKNKNAYRCIVCCCCCLMAVLCFACPTVLWAQADTTAAQQLNEVQINAKKNSFVLSSPTPVQLITSTELKRINSLSVADAIRYFSGVQLKDYGGVGGLKTINVRSMGANHTAVFYNGMQLANAQNGQVDLGRFSLENLEEISLYNAQNNKLLQPAKAFAAASALYLKTKAPNFNDTAKQHLSFGVKSGSFGLFNPIFNYSYQLGKRTALRANAETTNAHGRYRYRYTNGVYDTTVVRHNADILAYRAELFAQHVFADSGQLQVNVYNYNSNRGLPGAIVANKFDFSQRQWDNHFFAQTSYQSSEAGNYQLLLNTKFSSDYTRYIDPEFKKLSGYLDNRFRQQEIYFSIAQQYRISNFWQASLSSDYAHQQLDANLNEFAYPTRQTWLVSLASHLQFATFKLQGNVLYTHINDEVKSNIPAGKKTEFTPAVAALWQPFKQIDFKVRTFFKSIFRMPTFNDLYYTFVGNVNLRPEYTKQYDVGFSYQKSINKSVLKSIAIQSDVYLNRVTDKIVAIPTTNLFRWTMLNLDEVETKGFNTNLQSYWWFGGFSAILKVNYTYEQALDITPGGTAYRQQIPYIPLHSGAATLNIDYQSWAANYSFIYTGDRYSQKANIPTNYVPAWYTHDVALHKTFKAAKVRYRLSAEVNNLLNQHYDVILNYPMPGRNFRISAYANF